MDVADEASTMRGAPRYAPATKGNQAVTTHVVAAWVYSPEIAGRASGSPAASSVIPAQGRSDILQTAHEARREVTRPETEGGGRPLPMGPMLPGMSVRGLQSWRVRNRQAPIHGLSMCGRPPGKADWHLLLRGSRSSDLPRRRRSPAGPWRRSMPSFRRWTPSCSSPTWSPRFCCLRSIRSPVRGPFLHWRPRYLFTAFIVVPHALTFAGAFTPAGLLGAGIQTGSWLFIFWHLGFAAGLLAYAVLREEDARRPSRRCRCCRPYGWSVAGVLALVLGLTWLATAGAHFCRPSSSTRAG